MKGSMAEKQGFRRQFLVASGATALTAVAGCTDQLGSSDSGDNESGSDEENVSSNETDNGTENGEADEVESPELTVETEYNSREEYRQPGEQFNDFEDIDEWELLDGSAEPDTDVAFDGSQSLRLTAEDEGNAVVATEFDATDMSDLDVSMAVLTTTPSDIAIEIQLRDIYGGYASYVLQSVSYGSDDPGWFRICPGFFDGSSTPVEQDAIDELRIVVHNTGDEAEVWVDDIRTHPKPESGYVILCWDDGFEDFYEPAGPLHDEYDVNAVQAVVRQWTRDQRDGIMTIDQLKEREEAGDQIVAHGTHSRFTEFDEEDLRDSLETDKNWAVQQELEGGHYLVFPHNNFNQSVLDLVSDFYYAGGFNQAGNVNLTGVHGFDPLVLPRTIGHDLDIAMRAVDIAATHRQCTILNFHEFDLDNTMDVDDYEELLQYINETDDIEVIDFDDLWNMRRAGH
jgi:hypothetical protein